MGGDINMININGDKGNFDDGDKGNFDDITSITQSDKDIIEYFMKIRKQKEAGQGSSFRHLVFANQTYWEHFCDSLGYFKSSICASFYFFCHAFCPDIFEQSGSKKINELNDKIQMKYTKRIGEIKLEIHKELCNINNNNNAITGCEGTVGILSKILVTGCIKNVDFLILI